MMLVENVLFKRNISKCFSSQEKKGYYHHFLFISRVHLRVIIKSILHLQVSR